MIRTIYVCDACGREEPGGGSDEIWLPDEWSIVRRQKGPLREDHMCKSCTQRIFDENPDTTESA